MSIFKKMMDTIKGDNSELDDELYEDEYEEDEYEEEEKPAKRNGLFGRKSESDEIDDEAESAGRTRGNTRRTNISQSRNRLEVSMIKPTAFADVEEITALLLEGKAVVINLEGVHTELSQRIVDFVSGATYGIHGSMQKISNYVFIATPSQVELSGQFQDLLNSLSKDASSLNMRI